jgi:hypothetical protein
MKTKILLILIAGTLVFFTSCEFDERIIPSGDVTTEVKHFSDYDAIDVSNAFNVYVNFSDDEEIIEIEAEENLHPYIVVRKVSGTLIIGLQDHINIRGNATLNVYITTKKVVDYTASGASSFIVEDKLSAGSVSIYLSGASNFLGDLEVTHANAKLSGASNVEIEGNAESFDVSASGASNIRDYDFIIENLDIELSGASNAFLTVNNELSIDISGASNLYYRGTGVITDLNVSGASQVIKTD